MGEDFIRNIKDSYKRSQQAMLARELNNPNLFDPRVATNTMYPCLLNGRSSAPEVGQVVGLHLDGLSVQVLVKNRIIGTVFPEAVDELLIEFERRPFLHGYSEAKVVSIHLDANRFDVSPFFEPGGAS